MRHLILILYIVLLPLRGWAGDAMAVQMLHGQTQATPASAMHSVAAPAIYSWAEGAFDAKNQHNTALKDCHERLTASTEADKSATSIAVCEGCSACQLCHFVALTQDADVAPLTQLPVAQHSAYASTYLSAERAASFKPPIS